MSPMPSGPHRQAKKKDFQTPQVVFQPRVAEGMRAGIHQLIGLIGPTLGPTPHLAAFERIATRNTAPERLDSGGTIARRVIGLADREEDVGAMYLRHVLWRLQENEGDGTATAAVMFGTAFDHALRYITAGGNPMQLRQHFEEGLRQILAALDRQTVQLSGQQRLAGLARTICYDDELALMLGEIFDFIGPYGRVEIRKGSGRELVREYVEGMYWDSGLRARAMAPDAAGMRVDFENAAVLISDLELETPEQLMPLLALAVQNNIQQVLLISGTLSEKNISMLLNPANRDKVHVAAVKIPGTTLQAQQDMLEDLSMLTGGRIFRKITADSLETIRLEDLGRARRAWVDRQFFGLIGGRGDPRRLRQHVATLRAVLRASEDPDQRKTISERLGNLTGGSVTLYVGGSTPTEIEARTELANRTASAMRGAMREGVVAGGGIALLNCQAALQACFDQADDPDRRAAGRILSEALETPFRTIAVNSGYPPGKLLADVRAAGPAAAFDMLAGKLIDLAAAGLYDAAPVVKAAVRSAVGGVALALTTQVIVHRKNPPEQYNT